MVIVDGDVPSAEPRGHEHQALPMRGPDPATLRPGRVWRFPQYKIFSQYWNFLCNQLARITGRQF